jgi:hypothetical protein
MESLGAVEASERPSLQVRQISPESLALRAAAQGGRLRTDRHTALFAVASYLRVRRGTRTFEQLAAALWDLVERHFEIEGEQDHWQQEVLRVARNASRYTAQRDAAQAEAAEAALGALGLARRRS